MRCNLQYYSIPLPEDVQKLKSYGDYDAALKMIDYFMGLEKTSNVLKERLTIEKEVLQIMKVEEYPYTYEDALGILRKNIRDFKDEELEQLKEIGAADWTYVNGEVHFQKKFYDTLVKVRPEYEARTIYVDEIAEAEKKLDIFNKNMRQMKANGGRTVRTRIRVSIAPKKEFERPGEIAKIHLPIPKNCKQVSEFKILKTSHPITQIAPADAIQRTVYFETALQAGEKVEMEYEFVNHLDYVELNPETASSAQPNFYTQEWAPHIVFTPYLRMLLDEILEGETNAVKKARKIYDYVTTHVMYSYMREYFCIENISEYAAINLRGDCGVQALLFITLCRMAGIPARWQSGLYVSGPDTTSHDWAQFYVEPYGWVFADLSFGGSAYRHGEYERWDYYFGNLDVYRMPANSGIHVELIPQKKHLRADEIDNQIGELEFEDCGLNRSQLETEQVMIEMIDI
ncbi:MAG: transglutaminase-like domain-containing protein [Schaedlerella sp.]|nr:transglutaminase-like domain-containing protein [Schaedlerella sp.]